MVYSLHFIYMQEFDSCLAGVIEATPLPVPKVFYFFTAMMYQTMVLIRRGNVCPDAPYENLKGITLKSGVVLGRKTRITSSTPFGKMSKRSKVYTDKITPHE